MKDRQYTKKEVENIVSRNINILLWLLKAKGLLKPNISDLDVTYSVAEGTISIVAYEAMEEFRKVKEQSIFLNIFQEI